MNARAKAPTAPTPPESLVVCRIPEHPPAAGYAVCCHVLDGAKAAHLFHPTRERLGFIACSECYAQPLPDLEGIFEAICPACVRALGLAPKETVH